MKGRSLVYLEKECVVINTFQGMDVPKIVLAVHTEIYSIFLDK